jgi:hypothetical protein
MVAKRILCPDRLRRVPKQFSWVDHRLVRDEHIRGLSHQSLALYLFLVTVSDADGLSYYSNAAIERYLNLHSVMAAEARRELCCAGLIAYSRPLYQVLSLEEASAALPAALCEHPRPRGSSEPLALGDILRQARAGGAR